MKSMLLLVCAISPIMALHAPVMDANAQGGDLDSAEHAMRSISKPNTKHSWIMFYGDSNMRNTYWWWVTEKLNKTNVKLIKSKQFGLTSQTGGAKHWSDQEAVLEYPDGFEVRASFRFLHGSTHEFKFKTSHFH